MTLAWRNGKKVALPNLHLPNLKCVHLGQLALNSGTLAPSRKRHDVLLAYRNARMWVETTDSHPATVRRTQKRAEPRD